MTTQSRIKETGSALRPLQNHGNLGFDRCLLAVQRRGDSPGRAPIALGMVLTQLGVSEALRRMDAYLARLVPGISRSRQGNDSSVVLLQATSWVGDAWAAMGSMGDRHLMQCAPRKVWRVGRILCSQSQLLGCRSNEKGVVLATGTAAAVLVGGYAPLSYRHAPCTCPTGVLCAGRRSFGSRCEDPVRQPIRTAGTLEAEKVVLAHHARCACITSNFPNYDACFVPT